MLGLVGAGEPHEAEAAAVALFRVRSALEELPWEGGGLVPSLAPTERDQTESI